MIQRLEFDLDVPLRYPNFEAFFDDFNARVADLSTP